MWRRKRKQYRYYIDLAEENEVECLAQLLHDGQSEIILRYRTRNDGSLYDLLKEGDIKWMISQN